MKNCAIFDLDNTLYNWIDGYVPALRDMIREASLILNVREDRIITDLRRVHQQFGTVERPFALLETDIVKEALAEKKMGERFEILQTAFRAFNSTRKHKLKLYDRVPETLEHLRNASFKLVAFTDANTFAVVDRLRRFGLTECFDWIFCSEKPETCPPYEVDAARFYRNIRFDRLVELSSHERKPKPEVLLEILSRIGAERERALYVGDSMHRDILMAHNANVFSVWAEYGTRVDPQNVELLVSLSHWTPYEIDRDRSYRRLAHDLGIRPDATLHAAFSDLLALL